MDQQASRFDTGFSLNAINRILARPSIERATDKRSELAERREETRFNENTESNES
ncbi:MAG: hypothetical protein LBI42_02070 [Chitinispirillales bacterium]|jgi:hypothetical protein|nr:hypothetical protein [Chitinispirillales bacterium]